MRSTSLVVFLLIVITSASLATSPPRVESYRLDVTFIPEEAAMHGLAAITFNPTEPLPDKLVFYLHGELEVDSIKQTGRSMPFNQEKILCYCDYSYVANQAQMNPVSSSPGDTIYVHYQGYFNPSKARSESDYMRIDKDGVFLRALSYSAWFPLFLDNWKDSYAADFAEVTIRTPEDFTTVFAGRHIGDSLTGDTRISRWQAQATHQFHVQCTSQRFNKTSLGNVNVYYWDDSASIASALKIADFVTVMTSRFAESYCADATADEYHIVEMPRYGEISAGNVSGIPAEYFHVFDEETWTRRGLAHEIIHPFVRLNIDKNDPLYALVLEGFPSFFHLPILQEVLGDEWYGNYMQRTEDRYLKYKAEGKDRRGNDLPVEKPIDQITGDEIGEYKDLFILSDRALLFMNYLRDKMGYEPFAEFSRDLFSQKTFTDESFREAVAKHLGGAREDVDLWLSGNDYPERFRLANL
jgi:hypothetical protein